MRLIISESKINRLPNTFEMDFFQFLEKYPEETTNTFFYDNLFTYIKKHILPIHTYITIKGRFIQNLIGLDSIIIEMSSMNLEPEIYISYVETLRKTSPLKTLVTWLWDSNKIIINFV